ncbi:type IV toxin-antitoxin system AbiEi family antitoxin domain-containing protein [Massilicoli timonensis]|uniref:type IV toxin-antitoxin system AbiEi family antitoxin domain-containing protein n=1 Tax=Massilicoli timonensis TaxID=2015901 RepID=UPI003078C690
MDYINEIKRITKENGGIIDNKRAASVGISRAMLSKLCKENKIQRLMRGQYILADDMQDELLSIELRPTQLIFSHETALFLHGISDRMPFVHSVTAPSNKVPSKAIQQDCKIYYIKPELFELGKTKLTTQFGNEVTSYDLERTICDVIRSRNKVGSETFLSALKMYAADPRKDLNKLNRYAKEMKIAGVVRKYMEVLL